MSAPSGSEASAATKLDAVLNDIIEEKVKALGLGVVPVSKPPAPGFWNILFLLLLFANIAFLIYLVPAEYLEGPHWELLGKVIPVAGGTFVAVVAAWYKDWTVRVIGTKHFRMFQVALSLVILFFWMPWLRIQPTVEPPDATLFVDGDKQSRSPDQALWVSLGGHSFTVSKTEGSQQNTRRLELSLTQVIRAALGEDERRWSLCYPVVFESDMKGFQLRIQPATWKRFDEEFLENAYKDSLKLEGDSTLIFTVPNNLDHGKTSLPYGEYKVTPLKSGCKEGDPFPLRVSPDNSALKDIPVNPLQC